MQGRLPQSILGRKKHGFILPLGRWLENELRDFAHDTLCSGHTYCRGMLAAGEIEGLFKKQKGLRSIENNSLLWKLLVFEIWQRKYLR